MGTDRNGEPTRRSGQTYVGNRCPVCGGRDWRLAGHSSVGGVPFRDWRCDGCGHGTLLPETERP